MKFSELFNVIKEGRSVWVNDQNGIPLYYTNNIDHKKSIKESNKLQCTTNIEDLEVISIEDKMGDTGFAGSMSSDYYSLIEIKVDTTKKHSNILFGSIKHLFEDETLVFCDGNYNELVIFSQYSPHHTKHPIKAIIFDNCYVIQIKDLCKIPGYNSDESAIHILLEIN